MTVSTLVPVDKDTSAIGAARRAAAAMAARAGLDADASGKLALIVTELGTNLVKHAREGVLLLRTLSAPEGPGVEVLSLDRGPGMRNIAECLRDGYSTGGTFGTGFGAVSRAACAFDVYSDVERGTAIVARVQPGRHESDGGVTLGAVCVPQPGESECGDAWSLVAGGGELRVLLVDGLGHGPLAAAASDAAVREFARHHREEPAAIVRRCHEALRSTRGGVLGLAVLAPSAGSLRYCGVGNVAATLLESDGRHGLGSQNGTVGNVLPEVRVLTLPWRANTLLVLNSDGLSTRWSLDDYPGLVTKHPALVAGVLYRDFSRGRDDTTIVAVR